MQQSAMFVAGRAAAIICFTLLVLIGLYIRRYVIVTTRCTI